MLQLVNAGHKSLADYATIATRGLMDEIRRLAASLAEQLEGLSATAYGKWGWQESSAARSCRVSA